MKSLALLLSCVAGAVAEDRVVLFAAASLGPTLTELVPACQAATGATLVVSPGASGVLARQIEAGAPAHLFFAADARWMDYLAGKRLIDAASRVDVLGNQLVVVAPATAPFTVDLTGDALPRAFAGRLAVGDPASVPAGAYAQEAGIALGWWPVVQHRLAPAADVRAALRFVATGEVGAGIVYASDAVGTAGIHLVGTLPAGSHRPIRYPLACTATAGPAARAVLAFLAGPQAAPVYRRHGFTVREP